MMHVIIYAGTVIPKYVPSEYWRQALALITRNVRFRRRKRQHDEIAKFPKRKGKRKYHQEFL
eukprot:2856425-Amphidinium_carterae.1